MNLKERYEDFKNDAKRFAIAYAILGSLCMLVADTTGHYSADLYQGKAQLNALEKKMYEPIFKKFDINLDLLKK